MQTVPSLVGTGTVVAAATAGLLFGQPSESSSQRPPSHKRKLTSEYDNLGPNPPPSSSRPGTSSAVVEDDSTYPSPQLPLQPLSSTSTNTARVPRAVAAQSTPPKASARRHSFIRQAGDWAPPPISEVSRDSVSSNGSWMRRLSIRPLSQHGSPRSSVMLDSPSVTFSHGSGAPILSPTTAPQQQQQQQPRNKLVKRTTTGQDSGPGTLSRRGSRSQMPTLRRPATSHQRSATLQQFQHPPSAAAGAPVPKYSLDQQLRPSLPRPQVDPATPETAPEQAAPVAKWTSFFHSRLARSAARGTPTRSSENSPSNQPLPNRRIHLRQGSLPRAYLITPAMIAEQPPPPAPAPAALPRDHDGDAVAEPSPAVDNSSNQSPEETPSKRARRSISMHFSSPSNWIPRTGSLRRPKRGSESKVLVVGEGRGGGKRHVSAPVGASQTATQPELRRAVQDIFAPPDHRQDPASHAPVGVESHHLTRQRNSSSPLPPLSRLSSFNVDLSRLGASAAAPTTQKHHSAQASSSYSFPTHSRDVSNERASTGSDLEMRGFASGDDDDTDFKSDTMFDSLRTVGSARLRTVETPLESMFDESPPSTAGNSKTKRLSIQEILGRSWDGDTNIMEEDEGIPTPIRGAQSAHANADFNNAHEADFPHDLLHSDNMADHHHQQLQQPPPESPLGNRDFGRLSLDADDDDDDWARIDENGVTNHLSPPSSLVISRGVSPNLRRALASISGNSSPEGTFHDGGGPGDRPRSNVFDWSEPPHEKQEADGQSPRPKTVHGKQELDMRGGRSANRKGRVGLHARSHSVPVIADPVESTKSTSKFGTWASGPKNTNEDWDDDFDFDAGGGGASAAPGKGPAMVVPASIQATQPTVKAHSGQIRELSHLVNGLKRLCRHARELDIVDQSPDLWKEAENIIALASPDEEVEEGAEDRPSTDFDASSVDERYLDEGFDAGTLHSFDDPFEMPETEMSRTAVVRERQGTQRRSVFSDADNIFGNSSSSTVAAESSRPERPRTPDRSRDVDTPDSAMISSIMEAMQQQRSSSAPIRGSPVKPSKSELFFNTNTLQELVKRANSLFHTLSDMVRRADYLPQSPAGTPRRERHHRADGSPAFTRVFTDPSSPSKRLPKSHGTNSPLSKKASMEASASGGGMGQQQRMHMMTVN